MFPNPQKFIIVPIQWVHFKFTTYDHLLRRGQGEAIEPRKFEMRPLILTLSTFTVLNICCKISIFFDSLRLLKLLTTKK
jgi:hypothetical protein